MRLLLLRHADASTVASSDAERPLSEKGVEQARRVGAFCRNHELLPNIVLCSPLLRARQTAEGFVSAAGTDPAMVCQFLACGMSPTTALAELKPYQFLDTVLLIGHEPDFSNLVAHLLEPTGSVSIHIRKASLTLLELPRLQLGTATLEFSIPCRYLP